MPFKSLWIYKRTIQEPKLPKGLWRNQHLLDIYKCCEKTWLPSPQNTNYKPHTHKPTLPSSLTSNLNSSLNLTWPSPLPSHRFLNNPPLICRKVFGFNGLVCFFGSCFVCFFGGGFRGFVCFLCFFGIGRFVCFLFTESSS